MDTIFYNGRIHSLDDANTVYSAVAATNGIITALGADTDVTPLRHSGTEMIDLKKQVMFPGFIEAHNHLMIYGYLMDAIDLSASQVSEMQDVLDLVHAQTDNKPPGTWIKGSRYAEYFLAENRHPTRADLDRVSPRHPVILFHTSFHACALNSLGLQIMGIDSATEPGQGGIIEKDPADGTPTGVLHDQSMMEVFNKLFYQDLAAMTRQQRVDLCGRATASYAANGFVSTADALVVPQTLAIYQDTLAAGKLKIRIYSLNHDEAAEPLLASGIKTGFGCSRLRIGAIKIFADGGMSNRTAAVSQPYLTPPHGLGLKIQSRAELIAKVKTYHQLGFQIAVHAQGDTSIGDTLDAFEAVLGPSGPNPLRHRIEHAGCLYPDLLKRAAGMHISIAIQPVFMSELGDGFSEAFGPDRAQQLYPFKSMLDAGIPLGGSSDCPVASLDPRLGMRDAILRRTPSGQVLGPAEALSAAEALKLYTRGAAYLSFDENHNGTIELGKRADFTVMAADPRQVAPEEIPRVPFIMTVVGGEIVWNA